MAMKSVRAMLRRVLPAGIRAGLRRQVVPAVMRTIFYGARFECPICGARLRALLAAGVRHPVFEERRIVGGGYRRNCECPVCGSNDRERLLFLYLRHKTEIFSRPVKLLHVAPEPALSGLLGKQVNIEYLTADLENPEAMEVMDVTNIGHRDGSFDVILCNHVLEHVPEDRKAMAELYRVLKPGGWAILQVPIAMGLERTHEDFSITDASGREAAFGQFDHVRLYGRDYADRLKEAGFDVRLFEWTSAGAAFGGEANRFALLPDERLHVAVRRG
jgi:SAM-dependent methyltransferase